MQDDIRVRRNLTLSGGVRYEAQTHVDDSNNVMPRFGITWSPGTTGVTTLRGSWGMFHDWFSMTTYEQTLRVDGFHQREIDVVNPPYPQLGTIEVARRRESVSARRRRRVTALRRVSLGVDHRYRTVQGSLNYAYIRGAALARGLNLNAPIGGIRRIRSSATSSDRLDATPGSTPAANITANPGAMFPITSKTAPRVAFKRTTLFFNYTLGTLRNNTKAPSASRTRRPAFEWGPANNDVGHRMNVNVNNQIVKNLTVGVNVNAASGSPYTIRTGYDDNADLIFNDGPPESPGIPSAPRCSSRST